MDLVESGFRQAIALIVGADREIWEILFLSLQVSGSATLISLALGIPAGAALALARFPGRGMVVSAVNTGMGLPPVVVGLFVTLLLWRSGPLGGWEILYTPAAIVIAQAVIASPIVTGITLAAVQQVPASSGSSSWRSAPRGPRWCGWCCTRRACPCSRRSWP